jgi:hypothetical protein
MILVWVLICDVTTSSLCAKVCHEVAVKMHSTYNKLEASTKTHAMISVLRFDDLRFLALRFPSVTGSSSSSSVESMVLLELRSPLLLFPRRHCHQRSPFPNRFR